MRAQCCHENIDIMNVCIFGLYKLRYILKFCNFNMTPIVQEIFFIIKNKK